MAAIIHIFQLAHYFLCISGCSFNILLILSIFKETPKNIRTYSVLVCNVAFSDLLTCLADCFVQQRVIPAGFSLAFISTGPCSWINEKACFIGYSFMLHFYTHSIWLLLLSFSYRYYILIASEPKKLKIQLVILIFYLPSLFQAIIFFNNDSDPLLIRDLIQDRFPAYNTTGLVITGIDDITTFSTMFCILHITFAGSITFGSVLFLRSRIIKQLTYNGIDVAKNTRHLQAQLLKALTFQAIIPVFYLLAVVAYLIGQLGFYNHPALEYSPFLSVLFVPILTPVFSFIFVTPYRRFLKKLFTRATGLTIEATTSRNDHWRTTSIAMIA